MRVSLKVIFSEMVSTILKIEKVSGYFLVGQQPTKRNVG